MNSVVRGPAGIFTTPVPWSNDAALSSSPDGARFVLDQKSCCAPVVVPLPAQIDLLGAGHACDA